jgi:hypothetical protein
MRTLALWILTLCTCLSYGEEVPPAVESLEDPGFEKIENYWVLIRDEKGRVFFSGYQLKDKATPVFTR